MDCNGPVAPAKRDGIYERQFSSWPVSVFRQKNTDRPIVRAISTFSAKPSLATITLEKCVLQCGTQGVNHGMKWAKM